MTMPPTAPARKAQILVPPIPTGVKNNRDLNLFREHPLVDAFDGRNKKGIPVPFHAYSASNASIVCLADVTKTREYLRGIDYKPVTVALSKTEAHEFGLEPGQYALVNLVMNDYRDTSVGPYRALMLNVFGVEHAKEARPIDWSGPASAITAHFDSNVASVIGPLAMSQNPGAFDLGREKMGINKYIVDLRIQHDLGSTSLWLIDNGQEALRFRFDHPNEAEAEAGAASLFRAAGLYQSLALLIRQEEALRQELIGWDPHPSSPLGYAFWVSYTLGRPSFRPWRTSDELLVGATELGYRFDALKAKPVLVSWDPEIAVVAEPNPKKIGLTSRGDGR